MNIFLIRKQNFIRISAYLENLWQNKNERVVSSRIIKYGATFRYVAVKHVLIV